MRSQLFAALVVSSSLLSCAKNIPYNPSFAQGCSRQDSGPHVSPGLDWDSEPEEIVGKTADEFARFYAPELRFGPGETSFPTIPFFTAFDSDDNDFDSSSGTDWEDPGEVGVARLASTGDSLLAWDSLLLSYQSLIRREQLVNGDSTIHGVGPPRVVMYRVRSLTKSARSRLWTYLRNDRQAWHRSGLARRAVSDDMPLISVEYYFYYVNDRGVLGHPQDLEFAFVIIPAKWQDRCKVKVIIGAAHSDSDPNNVLLQFGADAGRTQTPLIVELGGHATAPDARPFGVFELGVDVNWHTNRVWGVRDVLATGGEGFLGQYQRRMTLSRREHNDDLSERWDPLDYALIPVQWLGIVYDWLTSGASTFGSARPSDAEFVQAFRSIQKAINDHYLHRHDSVDGVRLTVRRPPLRLLEGLPPDSALRRMQLWPEPLLCVADGCSREGEPLSRHQPWLHKDYRGDPTHLLKTHLFRPTTNDIELSKLFTIGWKARGGRSVMSSFSFVVPHPEWIPLSVPGFMTFSGGSALRFEWWPFGGDWFASLRYENGYSSYLTWYGEIIGGSRAFLGYEAAPSRAAGATPDSLETKPVHSSAVSLGLGASIVPKVNWARIRLGPELGIASEGGVDISWQVSADLVKR